MMAGRRAVVLGGCGVVFVGVVAFFQIRRIIRIKAAWAEVPAAAHDYATTHTQTDCLAEAQRRGEACADMTCVQGDAPFAFACLTNATPDPHLCDDVPTKPFVSMSWPSDQCSARTERAKSACVQTKSGLWQYCTSQAKRSR